MKIILLTLSIIPFVTTFGQSITNSDISFQGCEQHAYPPSDKDAVDSYTINLDLPPKQRWTKLIKDKKKELHRLVNHVQDLMLSLLGPKIFGVINGSLPMLTTTLPEPFQSEIIGISEQAGLSISDMTLYNVFYEVFSFCTSIIAQDENGKIFHGRNLDFGLFMGWDRLNNTWIVSELLRPLIVQLNFTRNGKTVFLSTSYTGYVGILTAVKKDKFTFTLDERFTWNGGYIGLLEWILFKDYNQSWVSFLTRDILEHSNSFNQTVDALSKARLLAPVYFIVGGTKPNEGVIITRGRSDKDMLYLNSANGGQGSWFLVETNYDHWKSPPFYDDRRTPAVRCLSEATQANVGDRLLYNVLSTKPVLNKLSTYTSLLNVYEGSLHTWLRTCPDPCWPW